MMCSKSPECQFKQLNRYSIILQCKKIKQKNKIKQKESQTEENGGCGHGSDVLRASQSCHLPPVGVSVAIDMAASGAAERRTL